MTDYSKWPEKPVQVTTLQLDPQNPRIPAGSATLGQRELIAELVQHDHVYELAKDIVDTGYYPVESLVGLTNDGKTFILEGNRRLAALKLLISPELAPDASIKKFRVLSSRIPLDSIKKVRVLYAPTREAAAPLIMQKHTRQQVERWSPLMQARFYRYLAASGLTLEELAHRYGGTPGDVAHFLRMDTMYQVACAMDLPEAVRDVVHDPREFLAAVLERLLDMPKTRQFLGIEFDETGALQGTIHPDEFRKGYARILTDIAQRKVDTRKVNTAKDAETYLATLSADAPNLQRRGRFTADDLTKQSAHSVKPAPVSQKTTAGKSTSSRASAALIPSGTKCRVANQRIRELFDELRRLKVDQFPNACAVLLRILLELCIGHYLDKTQKIKPLLDKAKKDGKPNDWYPTLKQMLSAMLQDPNVVLSPLAKKRLNKLASDPQAPLSLDTMDGFVHNRFVVANSRELRGLWDVLEGIFQVVLEEPQPPAKPTTPTN